MEKKNLSEHFTLAEMTRTSVKGVDNTPTEEAVGNLTRLCREWLEPLRLSYNLKYVVDIDYHYTPDQFEPVIVSSGYRSEAVNKAVGGVRTSNHLTGCAADIRCTGVEQALRYMCVLLDLSDCRQQTFDELIMERKGSKYWIHLAARPKENRRKLTFILK